MKPIAVKFSLLGEWRAVNTPGEKIPSHGTDRLGQTYAYDFIKIDWNSKGYKFFNKSLFQGLIFSVNLTEIFCWSQLIYSPFDGKIIDGIKEKNPVHILRGF